MNPSPQWNPTVWITLHRKHWHRCLTKNRSACNMCKGFFWNTNGIGQVKLYPLVIVGQKIEPPEAWSIVGAQLAGASVSQINYWCITRNLFGLLELYLPWGRDHTPNATYLKELEAGNLCGMGKAISTPCRPESSWNTVCSVMIDAFSLPQCMVECIANSELTRWPPGPRARLPF